MPRSTSTRLTKQPGPDASVPGCRRPVRSLDFGLFIPAAGKSLQQLYDEFQMAEDLGFDHASLPDHVKDTDGPPTNAMHETWTLLTAIAARTSRIRLGPLVSSNTFRHPALLLKQAVTVDHVSAGSARSWASARAGSRRSTGASVSTSRRRWSGSTGSRKRSRSSGC